WDAPSKARSRKACSSSAAAFTPSSRRRTRKRGWPPSSPNGPPSFRTNRLVPGPDGNRADRIGRRSVDQFRRNRDIDERVMRLVDDAIDARCLEKDASALGEGFFPRRQLVDIHIDRPGLAAGDGEIRRILRETERLTPAALAGLRDMAGHAWHLG